VSVAARGSRRAALLLIDFFSPVPLAPSLAPWALKAARHSVRLKRMAKAAGLPCIYINDNFGDWQSEFSRLVERCREHGGASGEIADLLAPESDDASFLKPRHSAFYGTPLEFRLRELGVSRLILAGLQADICIFYTAQEAYVRQYQLWIPANCVGAQHNPHYRAALSQMRRNLKASTRPCGRALALQIAFRHS